MGYGQGLWDNSDKYCYKSGMISPIFKKTIFISLAGHLALFNIFNFSFGARMLPPDFAKVSSIGAILTAGDVAVFKPVNKASPFMETGIAKAKAAALDKINRDDFGLIAPVRIKPQTALAFNQDKISFYPKLLVNHPVFPKNAVPILFYPRLPFYFTLYFKDRQVVHIELLFNIVPGDTMNHHVIIQRKISSGNLEADLLGMRYIERYLFIQQRGFAQNKWQSVKIDLSQKSD